MGSQLLLMRSILQISKERVQNFFLEKNRKNKNKRNLLPIPQILLLKKCKLKVIILRKEQKKLIQVLQEDNLSTCKKYSINQKNINNPVYQRKLRTNLQLKNNFFPLKRTHILSIERSSNKLILEILISILLSQELT